MLEAYVAETPGSLLVASSVSTVVSGRPSTYVLGGYSNGFPAFSLWRYQLDTATWTLQISDNAYVFPTGASVVSLVNRYIVTFGGLTGSVINAKEKEEDDEKKKKNKKGKRSKSHVGLGHRG
jgi:hypothetical protein